MEGNLRTSTTSETWKRRQHNNAVPGGLKTQPEKQDNKQLIIH